MNVTFQPKHESLKGDYTITVPTFVERMELMKKYKFETDSDGAAKMKKEELDFSQLALSAYELAKKYLVSLEIVYEPTGETITDLDTLLMYASGQTVLFEIYNVLHQGIDLGKN